MRIVFMGTPETAVPSLQRLVDDGHEIAAVWTQPDKPAGRGNKLHASPVKAFALSHNLEILQPAKIKSAEAKELFASHKADVGVVVAYGKILPDEFLAAPKHGCLNVHFSLLPRYRGAAPVNWAIVNGDKETGVTTMKVVAELDAGPVLLQKAVKIRSDETASELLNRLSGLGAELISETLSRLDEITPEPQAHEEATTAPILKREDGLIDWSMNAFAIERRIRGFQPWPNAYTKLGSRRVTVWKANAEGANHSHTPGEVIQVQKDSFAIACGGATVLNVLELQPEDSRRMSARDFLNGSHLESGESLG